MEKKLLVICGATATGKTNLALSLAKRYKGELISADSRQVYRGMDIGTGKDLPINSKLKIQSSKLNSGYYRLGGVKVWGYDLVNPDENFSVGQYIKFAEEALKDIWKRGKLPIIVGGTGFYMKALIDGVASVNITPNEKLRKSLERKSAEELFELLAGVDPIKAASMNISDKKNPRRLMRAIEIAKAAETSAYKHKVKGERLDVDKLLIIGLRTEKEDLDRRIKDRVNKRLDQGFEQEVRRLIKRGISWKNQAMHSLGYRQFKNFYERKMTKQEFVKEWISQEKKYAKRQITWFKKDKRIVWFNISELGWKESIEKLLRNW